MYSRDRDGWMDSETEQKYDKFCDELPEKYRDYSNYKDEDEMELFLWEMFCNSFKPEHLIKR